MKCEKCGSDTDVIDTRPSGGEIKRRRECRSKLCEERFTTLEIRVPEAVLRRSGSLPIHERLAMIIGDEVSDAVRRLFSGTSRVNGPDAVFHGEQKSEKEVPSWASKILGPKAYRR